MRPYRPADIEATAQREWSERDAFRAPDASDKPKYYCVSMLPYPSGKLHMGHVRNYTINDMMVRYLRMNGYNVMMPMGWDAFGLPAENAAMKNGVPPAAWTRDNIAYMKRQCQAMGWAIDWSREVATCDASYYKWNQWMFLKMLERGIAYRKTGVVNWDPVDQTVLANEQVIDGKGWRSGAQVEKREIPMYYLRITDYAEELLSYLDKMPGWPERVKVMQANWIGKSEGVRFAFTHDIRDADDQLVGDGRMYVFTTRADTIMGVTFCAVAAEHPLASVAAARHPEVAAFVAECKRGSVIEADMATMEKKGVPTGLFVTHPLTGDEIELWVGNYVLMSYGDGAVMGVPAHDERDFEFAKKYGLPIRQVIQNTVALSDDYPRSENEASCFDESTWKAWYASKSEHEVVVINSRVYNGLSPRDAANAVAVDLEARRLGEKRVTYRLRDWGISRQRYWGTPIPIVHCPGCGEVPVPEKDLPVVLPEDCVPDGSGNPLAKRDDFINTTCPSCGQPAKRETDTMDTFVDSSWYYMRYTCPDAATMVDQRDSYWMPMDQYIGGIEHAILHLLYARFWTKVMRDMGLVRIDEPFTRLFTQGMLLNHIYFQRNEKGNVDYVPPAEVSIDHDEQGHITGGRLHDGSLVEYGGIGKMGKSERNGVEPQELIDRYGADTARVYVMFAAKPDDAALWSDTGVEGAHRFLKRLWAFATTRGAQAVQRATGSGPHAAGDAVERSRALLAFRLDIHSTLKQANFDYERMQYNTVVSAAMKMLNAIEAFAGDEQSGDGAAAMEARRRAQALTEALSILLRVLYPAAPHITHALWQELGFAAAHGELLDAPWPQVDVDALHQDRIQLVLQVNGKLRGSVTVAADADRATIEAAAVGSPEVQRHANGATPRKVVVVPGKLVNVVV